MDFEISIILNSDMERMLRAVDAAMVAKGAVGRGDLRSTAYAALLNGLEVMYARWCPDVETEPATDSTVVI